MITLFQTVTHLKVTWMLRVSACFWHCSSCARGEYGALVSAARLMWTCKGDVNSALGKNSKEPSSSKILTKTFNDDSNKEPLNVNKVCH